MLRSPTGITSVLEGTVAILGSSSLTVQLIRRGLVDELRLMVNPVVLGSGARVLDGLDRTDLTLLRARPFQVGNVLLTYGPKVS